VDKGAVGVHTAFPEPAGFVMDKVAGGVDAGFSEFAKDFRMVVLALGAEDAVGKKSFLES